MPLSSNVASIFIRFYRFDCFGDKQRNEMNFLLSSLEHFACHYYWSCKTTETLGACVAKEDDECRMLTTTKSNRYRTRQERCSGNKGGGSKETRFESKVYFRFFREIVYQSFSYWIVQSTMLKYFDISVIPSLLDTSHLWLLGSIHICTMQYFRSSPPPPPPTT